MDMVNLIAPEGLTELEFDGVHYPVSRKGIIRVPVQHYPTLVETHGHKLADKQDLAAVEDGDEPPKPKPAWKKPQQGG